MAMKGVPTRRPYRGRAVPGTRPRPLTPKKSQEGLTDRLRRNARDLRLSEFDQLCWDREEALLVELVKHGHYHGIPCSITRYIQAQRQRALTFIGEPISDAWWARFHQCQARALKLAMGRTK